MTPRRVSIKDVAAHAQVSWKTVSNVVNDRPVVREATRQRVLRSIEELQYVPNRVGRDLRGGATHSLALVVPELANPYFARLAETIQRIARTRGYAVSVEVSLGDRELELSHLTGRTARPVDAVILSPAMLVQDDLREISPVVPVVLLGESLVGRDLVTHVVIDNEASAVDLVRHLVAEGRRRPVFLGARGGSRATGAERVAGYRRALRAAGIAVDPELLVDAPTWDRQQGRRCVESLLLAGVPFDAVIGANDLLAVGALAALRDAGRDVPRDVAVAGWDDIPEAAYTVPPLTTVAPDLDTLATTAVDTAISGARRNATSAVPWSSEIVVPHALVLRSSTRATGARPARGAEDLDVRAGADWPDP